MYTCATPINGRCFHAIVRRPITLSDSVRLSENEQSKSITIFLGYVMDEACPFGRTTIIRNDFDFFLHKYYYRIKPLTLAEDRINSRYRIHFFLPPFLLPCLRFGVDDEVYQTWLFRTPVLLPA